MSTTAFEGGGVELERARREHDVADVAAERAAVVLAVEQALDLALHAGVDVAPVVVEEADLHGVGIARREPHRDAALRTAVAHLEPGERHGGQLDVLDVDAGQVDPRDQRPLERPGDPAGVTARGDGRALRQRGAVGHRQAHRDLGVDVDVGEPAHPPPAEQRAGAAALPHDRRGDDGPRLDRLERVHLDVRVDDGVLADEALVADDRPLLDAHVRAEVGVAADGAAAQVGAGADVDVVVADRPLQERVGLHDHVGAEHGVGPQVRARLDPAAVADDDGLVDAGLGADLDVGADPAAVTELEPVDVDLHPTVEHVGVRPAVGLERADVLPVALGHVAVQRVAGLEQRGEHVAGEVDHLTLGDELEHLGLDDVDPGVDGVGEHLAPRGLLQEAFDGAVGLGDHDPELERVLDVLQRDRRARARVAVRLHERGEVDVGEHVTGDDEERVDELVDGVAHRTGGAERRVLGRVAHGDAEVGAVTEVVADLVGEERHRDDDLVEAVQREQADDVLHHRLVGQRHHRLRGVAGQRAQTRALTTGEDDGLHEVTLLGVDGTRVTSVSQCRTREGDVVGRGVVAEGETADRHEPRGDEHDVVRRAVDGVGPEVEGQGEHERERSGFAHPLDVDAPCPGGREREHRHADHDLPREHEHPHDERQASLQQQRHCTDQQQDPVGHRVEHLPEVAPLVEPPGDPAVDPVGGPEHGEQGGGGEQVVVGQQPQEDRRADQAHQRDHVGQCHDPRCTFATCRARHPYRDRTRSSEVQSRPVYAPPSIGMAVPVTKDAASEQRNAATRPKSSGRPITPAGIPASRASSSPP